MLEFLKSGTLFYDLFLIFTKNLYLGESRMQNYFSVVFVGALLAVGLSTAAIAQDKGKADAKPTATATAKNSTREVLAEGDNFRAYTATFQPGDVSPIAKRPKRVVHALTAGSLERTYEDGKKETSTYKLGETKIISEERPHKLENTTKSVVKLFVVQNIK